MCKLRAAACENKQAIIVLRNGACGGKSDLPEDVDGFFEDEDARLPDEEEDEEDNVAHEDDDQD